MKRLSVFVPLVVFAMLVAGQASAKDLNGRFAFGGAQTLFGTSGLSVKYFVGHLGVGLIMGHKYSTYEEPVGDKKGDHVNNETDTTLRILFNAVRAKDTNMYLGGGFTYGMFSDKTATGDETSWNEMGIELLLGVEHFFGNFFAVAFETGLPIRLASDDHGSAIGMLGGGTGMIGAAGKTISFGAVSPNLIGAFHFYF